MLADGRQRASERGGTYIGTASDETTKMESA